MNSDHYKGVIITVPLTEAFVKTFKRDYVHLNRLEDARVVMEQLPTWFEDYNENHPHKGLKMRSPRGDFREGSNATIQVD